MSFDQPFKNYEFNRLNEECGIFGGITDNQTSYDIYMGLHSLQHRGQDAAGIVTFKNKKIYQTKKFGSIISHFGEKDIASLKGNIGIGHVRYPTSGNKSSLKNIQPFIFKKQKNIPPFAIAHNGNLTNTKKLKKELALSKTKFYSDSDSEILGHLIINCKSENLIDKIKCALKKIKGAYCFLICFEDKIIACRDPYGIRPLVLGKKNNNYIIASETVALDINGAKLIRTIKSGEILIIDKMRKISTYSFSNQNYNAICAMEFIYFSRPDSIIEGQNVHKARINLGKQLAIEYPVKADIVIGVPDSSISAALGYSREINIPFEYGLIKNKYIGRSFIAPSQEEREKMIKMKLNPNIEVVKDKDIILIDDSIVRGTTMRGIVKLLHDAGAKKIHIRIASPEIKYPDHYGIDISNSNQLALSKQTKDQYAKSLKYVSSIEFLSIKGLEKGLKRSIKKHELNVSCFTGDYPIDIDDYQ